MPRKHTDDTAHRLADVAFFEGFTSEELTRVAALAEELDAEAGDDDVRLLAGAGSTSAVSRSPSWALERSSVRWRSSTTAPASPPSGR